MDIQPSLRFIRIIKKILYSVTKEQALDDESLQMALCEVEAIMNDRPTTLVSEDTKDPELLTPNHLLQLKGMPIFSPGIFEKNYIYSRRRWRQVQYISDLSWKRWTQEYLSLIDAGETEMEHGQEKSEAWRHSADSG